MDIRVGDVLELKKEHPCGSREWLVLRIGMDFRLRCQGCGHELMLPRAKAEKSLRRLRREGALLRPEALRGHGTTENPCKGE